LIVGIINDATYITMPAREDSLLPDRAGSLRKRELISVK
jgi:hypothetical protein